MLIYLFTCVDYSPKPLGLVSQTLIVDSLKISLNLSETWHNIC